VNGVEIESNHFIQMSPPIEAKSNCEEDISALEIITVAVVWSFALNTIFTCTYNNGMNKTI